MPGARSGSTPANHEIAQAQTAKAFGLTVPGELSLNGIRRPIAVYNRDIFAESAYDRLWHF